MSQLTMRRSNLQNLPSLPALPTPYTLRALRESEAAAAAEVLHAAFGTPWDAAKVLSFLICDPKVKAIFVIAAPDDATGPEKTSPAPDTSQGTPVASHDAPVAIASALVLPTAPHTGVLHYVGVHPAHQGQRLGYAVSLRVLHFLRDAGYCNAMLLTDDFRLSAIKTYLDLGFVPEYRADDHAARWQAVLQQLTMKGRV